MSNLKATIKKMYHNGHAHPCMKRLMQIINTPEEKKIGFFQRWYKKIFK